MPTSGAKQLTAFTFRMNREMQLPRHWLQGRLPDSAQTRRRLARAVGERHAGWLSDSLSDPVLWQINRRRVAGGVAVGLFVSWIPLPLQMILAACLAAVLRVHVPVSVVMVWFTNPLTIGPLLYVGWRVGSMATGIDVPSALLERSWTTLLHNLTHHWPVLMAGCLISAVVTAMGGYLLTHLIWRFCLLRSRRRQLSARSERRP